MELLVCGNIISLNLPVRLVFECVWRPSLRGSQRGSLQQGSAPAAGASANNVLHVHEPKHCSKSVSSHLACDLSVDRLPFP